MRFLVTLTPGEDGYIVAECPTLPGCISQGETREEALSNIAEAIRGYIASLRKHGEPIPPGDIEHEEFIALLDRVGSETMFRVNAEARVVEMMPGVFRRTLNSGERMTLIEITFESGAVVPLHTHEHEQIGYLSRGRLLFELGEETLELHAGDSWLVPSGIPHRVTALEPSVGIDVFSPVRTEYLDWAK